jgi:hypothetical protein
MSVENLSRGVAGGGLNVSSLDKSLRDVPDSDDWYNGSAAFPYTTWVPWFTCCLLRVSVPFSFWELGMKLGVVPDNESCIVTPLNSWIYSSSFSSSEESVSSPKLPKQIPFD